MLNSPFNPHHSIRWPPNQWIDALKITTTTMGAVQTENVLGTVKRPSGLWIWHMLFIWISYTYPQKSKAPKKQGPCRGDLKKNFRRVTHSNSEVPRAEDLTIPHIDWYYEEMQR